MAETGGHRTVTRGGRRPAPAAAAGAAALALLAAVAHGQGAITPEPVDGDPARGSGLYTARCLRCHGETAGGNREIGSPALHQQEDWYLVAQLEKFRKGIRVADASDTSEVRMQATAVALPDDQAVRDVAVYIHSLEGPPPDTETGGDPVAGKAFFMVCLTCHGEDGRGKYEFKSPALVGQNAWYIVKQLKKFQAGARGVHPQDITGAQMRPMALTLVTEQAVHDVVAYIGTLSK